MREFVVSVIIPVYNAEKFIGKAIESVINQTYQNVEIIIVEDDSKDNTYNICKSYAEKDARIKLYKNEKNLGMMSNWNHALEYVKGKFWAKLDADDWWEQHFIEDCYNIISKDENVGMVSGRYVLIDENDQIIPNSEYQLPEQFKNASTDFIWKVKKGVYGMFEPNLAFQGNGLIRSEILQKLGNYTLLPAGDTEMYFRIGAHYKIYFLDKLYHYYRIWSSNYTRSQVLLLDKADKNMHDARKEIFDYYFKQNKITKSEFDLFTKQNQFEYNKFLVAKYRKQNNINEALKILGQNFKLFPIATINFYISRIFNR